MCNTGNLAIGSVVYAARSSTVGGVEHTVKSCAAVVIDSAVPHTLLENLSSTKQEVPHILPKVLLPWL